MRPRPSILAWFAALGVAVLLAGAEPARAVGVFNIPRFVEPDAIAIGIEPEFTMGEEAGLGANLRLTQGLSELTHASLIIGTGGGTNGFRAGGNVVFDFFPDAEGQPGVGVALQGIGVRRLGRTVVEAELIPYLAKTYVREAGEVTPFVALPVGRRLQAGIDEWTTRLSVGALFKASEAVRIVLELGVAIQNTESSVSGGVVLYP